MVSRCLSFLACKTRKLKPLLFEDDSGKQGKCLGQHGAQWLARPSGLLSPPLPAVESGLRLGTQQMPVGKQPEETGNRAGSAGEPVTGPTSSQLCWRNGFSAHFPVGSSAGLGGWGCREGERSRRQWGERGKEHTHTRLETEGEERRGDRKRLEGEIAENETTTKRETGKGREQVEEMWVGGRPGSLGPD